MPDYQELRPADLSQETYWIREKLWFDNFAQNLPAMRAGDNALRLKGSCAGPCVVVGAGPSVERFSLLDQLKDVSCHVIAADKALVPLLKKGIVPEYVVSTDGVPEIAKFYDDNLVRENGLRMTMLVAGQVHPFVAKVGYDVFRSVYWFNVLFDDPGAKMSLSRGMYWMSGETTMAMSYGNTGAFAWSFADFLGHRTAVLVGIDFSHGEDLQPQQTMYWKGFVERTGSARAALKFFRWETNPFGKRVLTDAVWDGYREVMQKGIEASQMRTVQCSPLSIVHGPKVSCMPLGQALKKYATAVR